MKRHYFVALALRALMILLLPLDGRTEPTSQAVDYALNNIFPNDETVQKKVRLCLNSLAKAPVL